MMPSRQPGRRAIIIASIISLCITLVWVAAFRVLYVKSHPLGAWEESACQDTAPNAPAAQAGDNVLVGVAADVPLPGPGLINRSVHNVGTRMVMCALRSSDGALMSRFVLPFPRYDSRTGPNYSTPVVMRQAHDTVYVAAGGQICAVHITSGSQLWCHARRPSGLLGEFVVNDNVLLLNTDHTLEAFDPSSGAPLWQDNINDSIYRSPQGPIIHSFAESNGTVYAEHIDSPSGDPSSTTRRLSLCAREERTGNQMWCQPLAPSALSATGVAVGGGSVFAYLASSDWAQPVSPRIYALRASDGKPLWQRPLACNGSITPFMAYSPASDAASTNSLVVTTPHCTTLVVRAADGAVQFQWKATADSPLGAAVANGIVYLDTLERRNGQSEATSADILALRLSDASQVWHTHISSPVTRLILSGDSLYALTAPSIYAPASSSPATLVALRRTDGGELWQATSCGGQVDPFIWHDHLLGHEQGAPVWCHWPATDFSRPARSVYTSTYFTALNPVLP